MQSKKLKATPVFYHVTGDLIQSISIHKYGLKASEDGYIYLLTSKHVACHVAYNQLFLDSYILLEINADGITEKLEPDFVAEITAKHQIRVKQEIIKGKYIKMLGGFKIL